MIVQRGDVSLVRLAREDIELVRNWRNAPEIQTRMEYRQHITPEMQAAWFEKINNANNIYFLINVAGQHIGLIHAADIDWNKKVAGNCGIFIWDKKYLESAKTTEASLLFTDLGFCCGLEQIFIKILKDNTASIYYNKAMGYTLLPGQEQVTNQVYGLTPAVYFNTTAKLKAYAKLDNKLNIVFKKNETTTFAFLISWFKEHPDTGPVTISVETDNTK